MKNVLLICFVTILTGCNIIETEAETIYSNFNSERVWVFSQLNVPEENGGLETYYYYGSVSAELYKAISSNKLKSGFIQLQDVSYWGDNDLIYDYKDRQNSGDLTFRIEHIVRIRQVNNRPISGKGNEQFDEAKIIEKPTDIAKP